MKSIFIFGQKNILTNYYNSFTLLGYTVTISTDISKAHTHDILCLAGGGDVNAYLYGKSNDFCNNIDTVRDLAELELIWRFISKNKPIIAICRGLQVVNVYFGGTLKQDVYGHNQIENKDRLHKIICLKDGFLHNKFGSNLLVNSAHHQSVDKIGNNLIVDSISQDGVIESFFHKTLPIFAFQFHPERLFNLEILSYACSLINR